jgi:hypothetical protein
MSWRPWITVGLLFFAFVWNAMLMVQEQLPVADVAPEVARVNEVLRHLQYAPTSRRNNFKEMGFTDDQADRCATMIDRFKGATEKFKTMLLEQGAEVGDAFCPSDGVPQPYSALRYLVLEENENRQVFQPERLIAFEEQPWYGIAPVDAVYNQLERAEGRKADATLMGVSALLLAREADVLEGNAPWSSGLMGSWGFKRLKKDNPSIEIMALRYFSLMHFLTELANTRDGVCS